MAFQGKLLELRLGLQFSVLISDSTLLRLCGIVELTHVVPSSAKGTRVVWFGERFPHDLGVDHQPAIGHISC